MKPLAGETVRHADATVIGHLTNPFRGFRAPEGVTVASDPKCVPGNFDRSEFNRLPDGFES